MKETGLIFSTPMVKAIQEGLKTQTQRTYGLEFVNQDPDAYRFLRMEGDLAVFEQVGFCMTQIEPRIPRQSFPKKDAVEGESVYFYIKCPYGQVGDWFYVKETWRIRNTDTRYYYIEYEAGGVAQIEKLSDEGFYAGWVWAKYGNKKRTSMFLPKWAARIWREITDLRAERLQDITLEDCWDEGIQGRAEDRVPQFRSLWESLNAKRKNIAPKTHKPIIIQDGYTWESNPWVWPIEFKEIVKEA